MVSLSNHYLVQIPPPNRLSLNPHRPAKTIILTLNHRSKRLQFTPMSYPKPYSTEQK